MIPGCALPLSLHAVELVVDFTRSPCFRMKQAFGSILSFYSKYQ
jgi:hypothetical protein